MDDAAGGFRRRWWRGARPDINALNQHLASYYRTTTVFFCLYSDRQNLELLFHFNI